MYDKTQDFQSFLLSYTSAMLNAAKIGYTNFRVTSVWQKRGLLKLIIKAIFHRYFQVMYKNWSAFFMPYVHMWDFCRKTSSREMKTPV
jgi:hypothetical protein